MSFLRTLTTLSAACLALAACDPNDELAEHGADVMSPSDGTPVDRPQDAPPGACLEGVEARHWPETLGDAPAGATHIACLSIRNDTDVDRTEVARSGVPLPVTLGLTETSRLILVGPDGQRVPAQFEPLARWGSTVDDIEAPLQWVQVSTPVTLPAGDTARGSLMILDRAAAPDEMGMQMMTDGTEISIDTGTAQFTLDSDAPGLFQRILTGEVEQIFDAERSGFEVHLGDGTMLSPSNAVIEGFEIVEQGPVRVVLHQRGHLVDPGGATRCMASGSPYERLAFDLVAAFHRSSGDVDLQVHLTQTCGDAFSGPWTDDGLQVESAQWRLVGFEGAQLWVGGTEQVSAVEGASVQVIQRKGSGAPWTRRAEVRLDAQVTERAEAFDAPFVALGNAAAAWSLQMPWMRFREPQGLRATADPRGGALALELISEPLYVGEARGLWHTARLSMIAQPDEGALEQARRRGVAALERGLLVSTDLDAFNTAQVMPPLGQSGSAMDLAFTALMHTLHTDTVQSQWARSRSYGSQLWPDTHADPWVIDQPSPMAMTANMNYWNPTGAELLEFWRTGDPQWAWEMALPGSWLQMYSAYYNIGDEGHGNRNGFAVTSGGSGEGQWHRSSFGSDDYSYNQGMADAYLLRPDPLFRARLRQAGLTATTRYSVADEDAREQYVNHVDITRQTIQHYEMLMNCARFVPGPEGATCLRRSVDIMAELYRDNLALGLMCQGDLRQADRCDTPQQFMQNAMMYRFFYTWLLSFEAHPSAPAGLRAALVDVGRNLLAFTTPSEDGLIDTAADFAAGLSCTVAEDTITTCVPALDSDGLLAMYRPTRPHTLVPIAIAGWLGDDEDLTGSACTALEDAALFEGWGDFFVEGAGYWKGANQMIQGMGFGPGACLP
ncbi:MAG: hypothetical protein ACE366_00425 [Bradymonadia bacterium]